MLISIYNQVHFSESTIHGHVFNWIKIKQDILKDKTLGKVNFDDGLDTTAFVESI